MHGEIIANDLRMMYYILMEALHTAILILHVIGATIIIGVSFVTLVIEIKKYHSSETLQLLELIWKITGAAFGVQLLTGLYLAGSEWDKIGKIHYFWIKMFLFFVVGSVVGVINRRQFEQMKKSKGTYTRSTNWAWIGFLTFVTIAAFGVLIAESAA